MPFQPLSGSNSFSIPPIQGAPQMGDPLQGLSRIMQLASMASMFENRALSQQMNQMRMQMWQQQAEEGRTEGERKRILERRAMYDYTARLANNPEFRARYHDIMAMSPGKREAEFKKLKQEYIEPLRHEYDPKFASPEKVYNYLFYDKITNSKNEAKRIEEDYWPSVWGDFSTSWKNLKAGLSGILHGKSMLDIAKEITKNQQDNINNSIYLKDQQLRESQGEGFLDKSFSDMSRSLISELPMLAGMTSAAIAGSAIGGLTGGPVGATVGAAIPLAGISAYTGDLAMAQRLNADPNLTDEERQAAMNSASRYANMGANAVLGAAPVSFARPISAVLSRTPLSRSLLGRAMGNLATPAGSRARAMGKQAIDTALGMGAMSAGQQLFGNVTYGTATNQDVDYTQGLGDATVKGMMLGLPMGAAFGMRPSFNSNTRTPIRQEKLQPAISNEERLGLPAPDEGSSNLPVPRGQTPGGGPNSPAPEGGGGSGAPAFRQLPEERGSGAPSPQQQQQAQAKTISDLLQNSKDPLVQNAVKMYQEGRPLDQIIPELQKQIVDTSDPNIASVLHEITPITEKKLLNLADKLVTEFPTKKSLTSKEKAFLTFFNKAKNYDTIRGFKQLIDKKIQDSNLDPAVKQEMLQTSEAAYYDVAAKKFAEAHALDRFLHEEPSNAQSQPEGTNTASSNDNTLNSGTPTGAPTNAEPAPDGTTASAGGRSEATPSGVTNGATAQSDGTNQAPTGTPTTAGNNAGDGQARRVGDVTDSNPPTNAGARGANAAAGERANSAEPQPTPSGEDTSGLNDPLIQKSDRAIAEAAKATIAMSPGLNTQKLAEMVVSSVAKDAGGAANYAKAIYRDASGHYNGILSEQAETVQVAHIKKYLDNLGTDLNPIHEASNRSPDSDMC